MNQGNELWEATGGEAKESESVKGGTTKFLMVRYSTTQQSQIFIVLI